MRLKDLVRVIPDFPKPGVRFKDITTLMKESAAFHEVVERIAAPFKDQKIDLVVSPEARGFIIGSAVAYALGAGFVPARRPGRLPYQTYRYDFVFEAGSESLEIHQDAVEEGQRVLVVDDMLATGGTAVATAKLVERMGGNIVGVRFAMELTDVNGREALEGYDVDAVIKF